MLLTPAVIGMFWKLLFEQQAGVFNFFAVSLGLDRIAWLGPRPDQRTRKPSIGIALPS